MELFAMTRGVHQFTAPTSVLKFGCGGKSTLLAHV